MMNLDNIHLTLWMEAVWQTILYMIVSVCLKNHAKYFQVGFPISVIINLLLQNSDSLEAIGTVGEIAHKLLPWSQ